MTEQRTDEWFASRLGKVTASKIVDIMAKTKTGISASRANYEAQLIAERLSNARQDSFTNAAMQWGIDNEEDARLAYEFITGYLVEEVGFIDHPNIDMSGASPDGLVGSDGLVEIKCPNTATHIRFLETGKIETKYNYQMQWQMACTSRSWCDFVSYDPRLASKFSVKVVRVDRDDSLIQSVERSVQEFLATLAAKIEALETQYREKS